MSTEKKTYEQGMLDAFFLIDYLLYRSITTDSVQEDRNELKKFIETLKK